MNALLQNVMPILFLILAGSLLRRADYFEEVAIQRITSMVANLLVPCVIFTTFLSLEFSPGYLGLAAGFFALQCVLLGLGWAIYRIFHLRRRFFPFFHCAFAFGFMAVPLFSTVFGEQHMDTLVALGLGQELFVGLIFLTTARLTLKGEKTSLRNIGGTLLSPLFVMIFAALLLRLTGLVEPMQQTLLGQGLLGAIARLGSMTSVLTMLIVGYRMRFRERACIRESAALVGVRYALTFGVGYLFKLLLLDRFAGGDPWFDYAFFTLLSQHGSVVLTALVGEHGTEEDLTVASNAFVINAMAGIGLYVAFVFRLSMP